jgi:predicted HicB family RNase H-like nuclease
MVTIGIRVEPAEREQLEARASEQGVSLCAYLRAVIRRELGQREADKTPLRICQ